MSDAKSSQRFRLAVIITLGVVAALGSFWLLEVMRKQVNHTWPATERNEPDYHVEKFDFVRMSKTGQAQYLLSGAQLAHNPQDDSVDITLPVAQSVNQQLALMTMRADHARIDQTGNKVQLSGDVNVMRPPSGKVENLHLKTESLLILTDENIMQTDEPVAILAGQSTLTGIGMTANNASGTFRVLKDVHGTYRPPAPATAKR
jgi:lipopolysaccharide export system protein LptC